MKDEGKVKEMENIGLLSNGAKKEGKERRREIRKRKK